MTNYRNYEKYNIIK